MTSRRRVKLNQCWYNICTSTLEFSTLNVVVYFSFDLNNVRQRQNSVTIFNINFNNVVRSRNNVVNMNIYKPQVQDKIIFLCCKKKLLKLNTMWIQNLLHFVPIFKGICKRTYARSQKILKHRQFTELQKLYLNHFTW